MFKKMFLGVPIGIVVFAVLFLFGGCGTTKIIMEQPVGYFDKAVFASKTFIYDGAEHGVFVTDAPKGTTFEYVGNTAIDVGSYRAFVFMKKGKNELALSTTFTIEPAEITGVEFENKTVQYNGEIHTVAVTGEPENVAVEYFVDNEPFTGATDIGIYNITAKISGDSYTPLALNAVLEITKGVFSGVALNGNTSIIRYDGGIKKLAVTGTLPPNTKINYTYTDANGMVTDGAIDAGVYTVTATITNDNYTEKTLTATLTVSKGVITGLTYADKSVKYDGAVHQMEIIGTLPAGTSVTFRTVSGVFNGASAIGSYSIYARVLGGANYEDLIFTKKNSFGQDEERSQNLNIVNQQLPTVTALTVGATTGTKVYLSWGAVANAGSYRVHVYDAEDTPLGNAIVIRENTSQPITTTFDIRGFVLGLKLPKATYYFKVSAIPNSVAATTHGESNPSTETAQYYHDRAMLDAPAFVICENGFVKWGAVSGAGAYDLIVEYTANGVTKTKRVEFYDEKQCSVAEIMEETGYGSGAYKFSVCAYPFVSVGQQTVVDTSRKSNYTISTVYML